MKTCIYARKSTNKTSQSNTIDNQIKICKRFANQSGLEIVDTKIDTGTGRNASNRSEVKKLIQDGVEGKYQCVIIKGISRIYRNVEDGLKLIKKLHMNGIRVISIEESFDTSENIFSNGTLDTSMLSLYLIFAEVESKKIEERVKLTQLEKAKRGMWNNPNSVPFGYEYNKITMKLEVEPISSHIVKKIFSLYEDGYVVSEIITFLEKSNIKPPIAKNWRDDTIRYILRNETYTGSICYRVNKSEKIFVKNSHESIIENVQFKAIQVRLSSRARGSKNKRSPLMGLMKCNTCNSSMTMRKYHYTGEYYYYCSGYIKNGKTFCSSHKVKADTLENKILIMTRQYLNSFGEFQELQHEYSTLKAKIRALESKLFIIMDSFIKEKISIELFKEVIAPIETKIDKLKMRRDVLESKVMQYRYLRNLISQYNSIESITNDMAILRILIENIFVTGSNMLIRFKLE